tara:strand:+ start:15124 stop:16611 length:1488 start_codon:yes stop_codon:yes gene_type:complete
MNQDTVPINAEPQVEKPIKPIDNTTQLVEDNKKSMETSNQNTIITQVVNTFKNSEDIIEALQRLATEIPNSVLLNFFDKFLAIIENVLSKIQDQLGLDIELKDPDQAMAEIQKNLPKIKFRMLLTGVILKEMVQDPELQKVWSEFIEIFQDKYFQPFLIATLATLKEYEPQIEAQGEKVEKIVSKVINRTGDAASDAFGNVIAGIPYVGTVVSGLGGLDNIAKMVIANVDAWGELFLETSYRLAVTLKKISPEGLKALDGTIDMVINAYNTYLAVKNSIDKWNALAQGVKFNPDLGLSADKLTDMMMKKAENAGTLPGTKVEQPAAKIETPPVEEAVKPIASPEPVKIEEATPKIETPQPEKAVTPIPTPETAKDDQDELNDLLADIKDGDYDETIFRSPQNLLEDFNESTSIEKINNAINSRKKTDNFKNKGFNTKTQALPTNISSGRTNINEGMPSIQQSNLAPSVKVTSGGKRKKTRKKRRKKRTKKKSRKR